MINDIKKKRYMNKCKEKKRKTTKEGRARAVEKEEVKRGNRKGKWKGKEGGERDILKKK